MKLRWILGLIVLVFLTAMAFTAFGLDKRMEYSDVLTHFMGGFAWCLMAGYLIIRAQAQSKAPWFNLIFAVGLVMIIGVLWEFAEFGLMVTTAGHKITGDITLRDTLGDLMNDGLGAITAWYFYIKS